ncbi:hypothetical protein KC19_VG172000 [Ceratodon purpureus]|uniref:Uncharacterized protein n=1 Tax=Ceratodon purpureus TaxID=3225 RepID=A0A8T0HRK7_CERPU|nr:hypothetical protein KC19_VG172000 [Ceratodon purpureus]
MPAMPASACFHTIVRQWIGRKWGKRMGDARSLLIHGNLVLLFFLHLSSNNSRYMNGTWYWTSTTVSNINGDFRKNKDEDGPSIVQSKELWKDKHIAINMTR